MNFKKILIYNFLFAATMQLHGQSALPPAWNGIHSEQLQRDQRTRVYLPPTRIVWKEEGGGASIQGEANLLRPGNGQTDLANTSICVMKSSVNGHPSLLLDFGKELQGGLQLVTGMPGSQKPVNIRIRFGESVSEAMSTTGIRGATNDHAMRDFTLSLPWLGVAEVGNTGFRFVRIDLLDPASELKLKEVRAIFTARDIPYKGSFSCNDEQLNKIWLTGAYTVHLNMQEYLWDGIKRDRLVWVGDMHPEVMTINTVFGYNEVVPKSLDLIRDITPLPQWMNGISSYSIWWLLIHRDWYLYQGDLDYLMQQKTYMEGLLKYLLTKVDANGREKLDGNRFLDWPSSENQPGVDAGLQALLTMAMDAGSELCLLLKNDSLAAQCAEAAGRMKKQVPDANHSKQAAALMALSGLMDPVTADKEVISVGGAKNFSTFYGYYMLQAMGKAQNVQGGLDIIRTYWGAMLDLGATTFWEDFNMEWLPDAAPIDKLVPEGKKDIHGDYGDYCYKGFRHSLCHGWASGPTSWLTQHVLGFKVLEPGCKVVKIEPSLGDLLWAEGTLPTPQGPIFVRHEKLSDGSVKTTVKAPKGIRIIK
ncbi:alpha-L-rhamnosidase [Macellibacteroides fermentans]|uniref:alpha-L-rhamnosidase-related protein n=1 Tax=Macellibacteroides fermentans TaxID=879969 RepID=UPI003B95B5D8